MNNLNTYKVSIETIKGSYASIFYIMDNLGINGQIFIREGYYKIIGNYKANKEYNPNQIINMLGNTFKARKVTITY